MKTLRIAAWSLLVILILALAVWIFRLSLISMGISMVARDYGLSNLEFNLDEFDTRKARVSDLSFALDTGKELLEFHVDRIEAGYEPGKVIDGDIDTLVAGKVAVIAHAKERSEFAQTDLGVLIATTATVLSTQAPLRQVHIGEIEIFLEPDKPLLNTPVSLTYESVGQSKYLLASLDASELTVLVEEDDVTFNVTGIDGSEAMVGILNLDALDGDVTAFAGSIEMDIGLTRSLLKPFILIPGYAELEGDATLVLAAQRQGSQWEILVEGDFFRIDGNEFALINGRTNMDLAVPNLLGSEPFVIRPGSRIFFESVAGAGVVAREVSIEAAGSYDGSQTRFAGNPDHPLQLSLASLKSEDFSLSSFQANLFTDISRDRGILRFTVSPNSNLSADKIELEDTGMDRPEITFQESGKLSIGKEGVVNLQAGKLISPGIQITIPDGEVQTGELELGINSNDDGITAIKLLASESRVYIAETEFNLSILGAGIQLFMEEWHSEGWFELQGLGTVFDFRAGQRNEEHLEFEIQQQQTLSISESADAVNHIISGWLPDVALQSGDIQISIKGNISQDGEPKTQIFANLSDVQGNYTEINFTELDMNGPVYLPPLTDSDSATINIGALEYGAVIENLVSEWRLERTATGELPGLRILKLRGEFLGGRIDSRPFRFDPNVSENSIFLMVHELDLENLMAMQQIDGLSATGSIDGELPVVVSTEGVTIESGKFWNREDGTIRYSLDPEQAASFSNPLTDTALRALEEFNYTVLTATTDFRPSGDLFVNFHIEGTSPGIENNRPVHLNINTEQNLLSLLKSLQYAGDLNEQLDSRIRQNLEQVIQ